MSEFYIAINNVNKSVSSLDSIQKSLRNYSCEIEKIARGISAESSGIINVKSVLGRIGREVSVEAEGVRFASSALKTITSEYVTTESKLSVGSGAVVLTNKATAKHINAGKIAGDAWKAFTSKYDFIEFLKGFGNFGKLIGIGKKVVKATTWNDWASIILSGVNTGGKILKDYKNYKKVIPMHGAKNTWLYFFKKELGFRKVGHASTFSDPCSKFYNNLHNGTSPFNLKDAFAPLTGKAGVGKTVAAWAGVALTGVSNFFSNKAEQAASNGQMSDGRVVAETVTETAIDTVVTYGGAAVVGAAITAATGVVAAPVVVAAATGIALAGINAGVEALTGKSATEWVSDGIIDGSIAIGKGVSKAASYVGKGISSGAKSVGKWFKSLSTA